MNKNEFHISNQLGRMIARWETANPKAIRALKEFDEKNDNILTRPRPRVDVGRQDERPSIYICHNGEKLDLNRLKRESIQSKPQSKNKKVVFKRKAR